MDSLYAENAGAIFGQSNMAAPRLVGLKPDLQNVHNLGRLDFSPTLYLLGLSG